MRKYILTFCALTCFALATNAQTKKESKAKTEKASKSQAKILENGTAKIDDLYAYQVYGESFEIKNTLTKNELAKLFDNMKNGDALENVQFVSTIESVCKKKGCWMKVDLGKGEEQSFVRFKDYGFFMPLDGEKANVVVHGKAFVSEISVEKLRHYAEDAGKTKEEIAKITKPQLQYNFEADGVYLKEN
ncbi:DUF4920 domain-containing protein [Empedobacter falsenii]|uniref:DUF4920 domain-containing protein n=2 Tax=Empedobacter TaxID=59734 RepID=A0ABY8V8M1_9FLAO|nr:MULTISPECIES: DUF4920 domain-containing protein [Empedobacter]WIH97095.1 DUF4920 domain-containing protein [Empedobacter falsenii]HJD86646.1 DUF4920 domain-containing protein [Empedobacter falsenii]